MTPRSIRLDVLKGYRILVAWQSNIWRFEVLRARNALSVPLYWLSTDKP